MTQFTGLSGQLSVSTEQWIKAALQIVYLHRHEIVEQIALRKPPEFLVEAQAICESLLVIESFLHVTGVSTELETAGNARRTYLADAVDILAGTTDPSMVMSEDLLAAINKQFRPYLLKRRGAGTSNHGRKAKVSA